MNLKTKRDKKKKPGVYRTFTPPMSFAVTSVAFWWPLQAESVFRPSLKIPKLSSRTFGMNGSPFLFSINHNTGGFFNANPQAAPLQTAFFWFKNTLEVIFPDQPLQETSLLRYKVCKDEFSILLKEFDTGIEEIKLEPVSKEKVFENLDARTQQKLNLEMVLFTPFMQLQNLPQKDEQQKVASPKNEIYYSTVIRNRRNIFIITSENDKMFLKITRRRKFQLSRRVIRSRPREQSNKRVSKETLS